MNAQLSIDFRGETFDKERDGKRLGAQLERVLANAKHGQWTTLAWLAELTNSPKASVSARLRDLRRLGYTVERRYVERGLWEYRVQAASGNGSGRITGTTGTSSSSGRVMGRSCGPMAAEGDCMNLNAINRAALVEFKGETFDPQKDQARLETQYARVLKAAKSAEWFTLGWMSARTGAPEASVSARLRDFRRAGYTVERRRVPAEPGLWEYRLMLQKELPL